ncbi:hypothetical protein N7493_000636 [Penicillium malachiteum]|uniref:Uncharacterized protein n=1 Tax=Penicillium malachiteum TaxID=1324776 RepID=A0AAD6HWP3_9EURO|nr:hypothetical protein N7493_000636 [Penicillium malachiteum]
MTGWRNFKFQRKARRYLSKNQNQMSDVLREGFGMETLKCHGQCERHPHASKLLVEITDLTTSGSSGTDTDKQAANGLHAITEIESFINDGFQAMVFAALDLLRGLHMMLHDYRS